MTHKEFESRINKAVDSIKDLPESQREILMKLIDETRGRHDDITHNVEEAKHNLDNWRVMM